MRESFTREELASIVERARNACAVTLTSLRLGKLSGKARGELLEAVARAGLELTGTAIRVALRDQIRELIKCADASGIPSTTIARQVKGAASAEVAVAVRELIRDGELALVADARASRLALPGPALLSDDELATLSELTQALTKVLKTTRASKNKPRPTLLRSVLDEPVQVLQGLAAKQDASRTRTALHAALAAAPLSAGLVRVPDLIRALESEHSRASLLAALDTFTREGLIELRPDSAIGRLPDDDRARCPVGIDGTPLVFARPLARETV
jgi:hypothetical protein